MARKVLVVDDEKLIVKGIRFSLEQDGMEVTCAYDGQEALDLAKENTYDVILLDVMLPKMDGFEVYGAALDGGAPFREIEYPPLRAIVIGNEGKGISTSVLNSVTARIFIPMKGKVESLNAAVSCAVILYHLDSLN